MTSILPFKALRPAVSLAPRVAARPYDVLNSKEAGVAAKDNAYSFLHVTKSEIDLPETVDIHSQAVYDKAKRIWIVLFKKEYCFKKRNPAIIFINLP
jgi:uncharacterized protein (DUF1015 family)